MLHIVAGFLGLCGVCYHSYISSAIDEALPELISFPTFYLLLCFSLYQLKKSIQSLKEPSKKFLDSRIYSNNGYQWRNE
jgi:hypothetical protein